MKWRLETVTIRGFRGVRSRIDLAFDPTSTIIVAPNGTGKTSIVAAVEWCLFGLLPFQATDGVMRDEIVNALDPGRTADVSMVLSDGSRHIRIRRTKTLGERGSSVTVSDDGGDVSEGDQAEDRIFRLFGITSESFVRAVYLHQESIRGLLLDDPKDRNDALDRLFGVDKLRDFLGGLTTKTIKDRAAEIESGKRKALDRIAGQLSEIDSERARALNEARRAGLAEEDLSPVAGARLATEAAKQLAAVAKSVGIERELGNAAPDIQSLEQFSKEMARCLRDVRKAASELGAASDIATQLVSMRTALDVIGQAEIARKRAEEAFQVSLQTRGSEEALTDELERLQLTQNDLTQISAGLATQQQILADALLYLDSQPDATDCPVCGQTVDARQLRSQIESQLATEVKNRLLDVANQRRTTEQLIREKRSHLSEVTDLGQRRDAAIQHEHDAVMSVRHRIDLADEPPAQIAEIISKRCEVLEARLVGASEEGRRREEALQDIDALHDRVKATVRYLAAVRELNDASANRGELTQENSETDLQLDKLATLLSSVEAIGRAVTDVASTRARDALTAARSSISDYYQRLCGHPYFDDLQVEVTGQHVRGQERNNYRVKTVSTSDAFSSLASTRLSTAQMNCVALSIYLALATRLDHELGFLILDDPSQSLDTAHKTALASLLVDLGTSVQLVVATEDQEMGDLMRRILGNGVGVIKTLKWAPTTGTVVEDLSA